MDSRNERNLNTIEKITSRDLLCDLIVDTIEEAVDNTPIGENKKDYLLKTLSRIYSGTLAEKIMGILPDDFFTEEEIVIEKQETIIKPIENNAPILTIPEKEEVFTPEIVKNTIETVIKEESPEVKQNEIDIIEEKKRKDEEAKNLRIQEIIEKAKALKNQQQKTKNPPEQTSTLKPEPLVKKVEPLKTVQKPESILITLQGETIKPETITSTPIQEGITQQTEEPPAPNEELKETPEEKELGQPEEVNKKPRKKINWKNFFSRGKYFIPAALLTLMPLSKQTETNKKVEKEKGATSIKKGVPEVKSETLLVDPRFNIVSDMTTRNPASKPIDIKKDLEKNQKAISEGRFNLEVYGSLPEKGKEIYKRYSENSPTPGRGYQILDKKNATLFVFDAKNKLITKTTAGFGADEGDEANTSAEYKKGKRTSPAGVYLISDFTTPSDIKEYGELQFSLIGVSLLNDTVFLGIHQTFRNYGELEPRLKKLDTPTPSDNKFSDGCINIKAQVFEKGVKPFFKGNYSELCFILPDQKSEKSGVKFSLSSLLQKIMPLMIVEANDQKKMYSESIPKILVKIKELEKDAAKLQENHAKLIEEYKKDRKNISKQKKIEMLKKEIKDKIEELSKERKELNGTYKKIEEIDTNRINAEKVLLMNN